MSDPIPVERLAEARQAMEGEAHRKKREIENQNLLQRREEARRAMEGEERRRRREAEAAVNRTNQEKATAAAAEAAAALTAARQTAQSAVAAEREKEMKAAAAEAARRRQAEATTAQIAKLKNAPLTMESIRTLKTDLSQATAHGATITQAIIRGQNQPLGATAVSQQSHRGRGRWLFLIFILLGLGAGGVFGYFYWFKLPSPRPEPPPVSPAAADQLFISTDQQIKIALDGLTPAATILKLRPTFADGPTTAGQLTRIIPTKTEAALTWSAWLATLPEIWPEKLKQTFEPKFLFGRYDDGNQPTVFLLLKVKNYNETFAALRAAETELTAFFYLLTGRAIFSPSTTTPIFNSQLSRNLETRRLVKNGQTILLSAFLNQKFFVLAENERAFGEIVNRWDNSVLSK